MSEQGPSPEQVAAWKQDMYDKLSKRQRKWVDRLGYENWDPFQKPSDPIDIRTDATGHTAQQLVQRFRERKGGDWPPDYAENVNRFCVEMVANVERIRPIYDFCLFYSELLAKTGTKL